MKLVCQICDRIYEGSSELSGFCSETCRVAAAQCDEAADGGCGWPNLCESCKAADRFLPGAGGSTLQTT